MDLILIQIVKELLELYDSITTEELAERIGISLSSVRHRMNEVRELFGKYGIAVISISKKGIKIEASTVQRNNMYNFIQGLAYSTSETKEYRKDYILKTLFEYSDNYTLQLFAEELYVSKKVISNDLKEVKGFLAKYNVNLVIKRNSGVRMEGNEFGVRQAMISHYNSLWWYKKYDEKPLNVDCRISRRAWTYMKKMYGDENVLDAQRILLDAEEELGVIWTDIAFSRLLEYVVISKRRIQKNWTIENEKVHELIRVDAAYYQASEKALNQISAKKVSMLEIKYLAARIYVAETICSRQTEGSQDYQESVKLYLKKIGEAFRYSGLENNLELVREVCEMLLIIRYKVNYDIVDWNDSNREVKKNISELYGVCLMYMNILGENGRLSFEQDDVAKITILIHNYMRENRKEAVFVTATDHATAAYQLGKLQECFPEFIFKEAVHYRWFRPEDYRDKMIISTVNLKKMNIEAYHITKHVNEEDIRQLSDSFENKAEIAGYEWLASVSKNLFFELSARNREDVIKKTCVMLRERGVIDDGFEKRLLEQEACIPTSVGNKMAIPHVLSDKLKKEFVAIVKLRHQVLWDEKETVKILAVIAVRESHVKDALGYLKEQKSSEKRFSKGGNSNG